MVIRFIINPYLCINFEVWLTANAAVSEHIKSGNKLPNFIRTAHAVMEILLKQPISDYSAFIYPGHFSMRSDVPTPNTIFYHAPLCFQADFLPCILKTGSRYQ